MAETHELRLQINASAAQQGSRQFVGAIDAIRSAVRGLERDADGTFSRLRRMAREVKLPNFNRGGGRGGGGGSTAGAAGAARANNSAAQSADRLVRAQLAARSAMRQTDQEALRLQQRLATMGDSRGIVQLQSALIRLRGELSSGATSTLQVRQAMDRFAETTNRVKLSLGSAENQQRQTARAARELATREREAAKEARKLESDMRSSAGAANAANRAFRNAAGGIRGLENAFSLSFQAASAFRMALGAITLGSFTSNVFRAGDALEQFKITMEVASGSVEAANNDLSFINALAADLGTNLSASRDAFSKFAVSAQIAGVSGNQTKEIFESVSTAMAVLGKGTEDQRLAFLALEQMMSKGVISAEELRRQLGERLPGAVNLMARAVGVSTQELQGMLKRGELISSEVLPKFARELNRVFGSQLSRTFNRAGSNLGRLQVEFQKFLETVAQSGFLDTLSREFRDLTTLFRSGDAQEAARALGRGFADLAESVGTAVSFIVENINQVGAVAKAIFGVLIVRQLALMGGALGLAVQQMAAASAAAGGLRAAFAGVFGASVASQAAGAAGSIERVGREAAGTAAKVGILGRVFGGLGRIFSFIAGPIGIAIGLLALVPFFLDDTAEAAERTSGVYEDAMSRMNSANFSFIDRAREVADATPFEAITKNLVALDEARRVIGDFNSGASFSTVNEAFASLNDSIVLGSTRTAVSNIQSMVTALQNLDAGSTAAVEKVNEIKEAITALIAADSNEEVFKGLRGLEDALLPVAQAVITANGLLVENKEVAGPAADELDRLRGVAAQLTVDIRALIEGSRDISTVSDGVRTLFESIGSAEGIQGGIMDFAEALGMLSGRIRDLPTNILQQKMFGLLKSFDGSQASISELTTAVEEFRAKAAAAAADDDLNDQQRRGAQNATNYADRLLELVDSLIEAQSASDATAAAQANVAAGIDSAAGAAGAATGAMYDYATALQAVAQAQAAVSSVGVDFRKQAALRVRLSELDGREAAVFRDRFFGTTARAVGTIDKEIASMEARLNSLPDGQRNLEDQRSLNDGLSSLQRERERVINSGESATESVFDNSQSRRSRRRGGGRRGGGRRGGRGQDPLKELKRDLERLRDEVFETDTALGKLKRTEALLEEGVAAGLVTRDRAREVLLAYTTQNADAIASEADAGEMYISTAEALGMSTAQRQAAIAARVLESALTKEGIKLTEEEKNALLAKAMAETEARVAKEARIAVRDDALSRIDKLKEEALALKLLSEGQVETSEAADLMSRALLASNGAVDQQTLALIRAADAAGVYVEKMRKAAKDPVQDWLDQVPTWKDASDKIQVGALDSLSDSIAEFARTGKFDFESLGASILKTATDVIADIAVKELVNLFGGLVGGGSTGGPQGRDNGFMGVLGSIFGGLFGGDSGASTANRNEAPGGGIGGLLGNVVGAATGGGDACACVGAAGEKMVEAATTGGEILNGSITEGMSEGSNIFQQVFDGIFGEGGLFSSVGELFTGLFTDSGTEVASFVSSSILDSGTDFAELLSKEFSGGADLFSGVFNGLFSGGGGGGGLGDAAGGFLGSLFSGGGGSGAGGAAGGIASFFSSLAFKEGGLTSSPANANAGPMVSAAAFRHAPSFAVGTANTSGIPAVLHPNEAVIPLSKGRGVPVEMSGGNGNPVTNPGGMGANGNTVLNQTFNIQTSDSDSFRKSQAQIAADAAQEGQRALRANR